MNTVSVSEVVRRYHISHSQRDYKNRLDSLTESLIREYLEVALSNTGHRQSDILCIRNLNIPISFDPDKTDFEIFSVWLNDMEFAITNMFTKGHQQQWLTYSSMVEALVSVARCISNRYIDDQWAWQQLGILPASSQSLKQVKVHWINYLSQHKQTVPAVLAGVRKDHTIHRLLAASLFDSQDIAKLVQLNFEAHNISISWPDIFVELIRSQTENTNNSSQQGTLNLAAEQFLVSIKMLNTSWKSLFADSELSIFIKSVFKQKAENHSIKQEYIEKLPLFYGLIMMSDSMAVSQIAMSQRKVQTDLIRWFTNYKLCLLHDPDSDLNNDVQNSSIEAAKVENGSLDNMFAAETSVVEQPSTLTGSAGGLLFIFNLLLEDKWNSMLMALLDVHDSPILFLEQLSRNLLPDSEQDAVVSVFSGAIFESVNQASLDNCFSHKELADIEEFSDAIKLEIVARITGQSKGDSAKIFTQLCNKKVNIEFAPGWVKVFYSLDDVDTKVRASGLDLDPGFISWLGYMVTFYYE